MPQADGWTYPTCATVGIISGCEKVVPCGMPDLEPTEECKIDASGCQSVLPGGQCDLKCRFPHEGVKTVGRCPDGNTNPDGLMLDEGLPLCTVIQRECDKVEPVELPAPFAKIQSGWQCATGYTGAATKTCVPDAGNCELTPVLSGCSQLMPCKYTSTDCRHDAYDCVNVPTGGSCRISCNPPYAGDFVTASCTSTNDRADGLLVTRLPP